MILAAQRVINVEGPTHLVSGGAAWADHIAVNRFLNDCVQNLTLHLPAIFDALKGQYEDDGTVNYKTNPGGTANYYHRKFSDKCEIDSLWEVGEAWAQKAKIQITPGFLERNSKVAEEADILLAMTFGSGPKVKDGGTADTVRKFLSSGKKKVYHFDLNNLSLHDNGRADE